MTVSKNQLDHLREVVDRPITFEYIIQVESFTIVATEKKERGKNREGAYWAEKRSYRRQPIVRANAHWIINLNNYLRIFGINRFNARRIPQATIKK